jgi:hypothetical protein
MTQVESAYRFEEPTNLLEAENRIAILTEKIDQIAVQLNDPTRKEHATPEEYQKWRKGAANAHRYKKAERSYLARWKKQYVQERKRMAQLRVMADPSTPNGLLLSALELIERMTPYEHLFEDDQVIISAIKDYFEGREPEYLAWMRSEIRELMPALLIALERGERHLWPNEIEETTQKLIELSGYKPE